MRDLEVFPWSSLFCGCDLSFSRIGEKLPGRLVVKLPLRRSFLHDYAVCQRLDMITGQSSIEMVLCLILAARSGTSH
jgi:hypothetical protein